MVSKSHLRCAFIPSDTSKLLMGTLRLEKLQGPCADKIIALERDVEISGPLVWPFFLSLATSDKLTDQTLIVTHCECQTVVPQGSKDLAKVLVCAPYTGVFADCRGHDLHNLKKTARSPTTVTARQRAQQSIETQSCSRETKTDYGGADGWQPKSPRNSIWQGKPACCLRRFGVQPRLLDSHVENGFRNVVTYQTVPQDS